jgi:ATP/maltotriose-dependent transcriptional regulator MalT
MAARVTVMSAPAGSGKTVLLRSWISEAGLGDRVAWVSPRRDECDPQQFWLPVIGALRQTAPGSELVRELTAAPDLDGWAIVERLLKDLAPLDERVWLVIDDVHDLDSGDLLRQLELLVLRAAPELRFVLATRRDMRLGLHRLRLEGELTEIRSADLRFTAAETRALFQVAGVRLSDSALGLLYERTEGWAAGLRLAALSLAGHPDPERFAAEFSGSERTVAEYLLAEVLERQPEEVRRLLLRTSLRAEAEPATAMAVRYVRALLELARGRDPDVLATFQAAERLSRLLHAPDWPLMRTRALRLHALVRLGETGRAEQDVAEISEQGRASGDIRMAIAALRIAQEDPHAATVALAPVLSGAASVPPTTWLAHAYLLEAIARDALGDPAAAGDAMRRALDTAEVDGAVTAFLFHPPGRELFDRYAPDRGEQAVLVAEIRSLLPAEPGPGACGGPSRRLADSPLLVDPLSQSEIRVLRYLPTNLSAAEIADELSVSVTTVRTHIRHLFLKLGAHRRTEAVAAARALGLLAPSPGRPENGDPISARGRR